MIDYVGDLSRADAWLLRALAERSDSILEFGCGASTQIFAVYGARTVESVETDPAWVSKTQRNIARFKDPASVVFHRYDDFIFREHTGYGLIFVDGVDELRREFAMMTWPMLAVGGVMCFHDTRRTAPHGDSPYTDLQNALAIAELHSTEVDRVVLNQADSNITVITKRKPLPLEDWNLVEGRTPKQIGIA